MKVAVSKNKDVPPLKFPCLMETRDGSILLMLSENSGMSLKSAIYKIGTMRVVDSECLKLFTGKLEISNE